MAQYRQRTVVRPSRPRKRFVACQVARGATRNPPPRVVAQLHVLYLALIAFRRELLPNCHPIRGCLLHREFGKATLPGFLPRTPLYGPLSYPASTPLFSAPLQSAIFVGHGSSGFGALLLPQCC